MAVAMRYDEILDAVETLPSDQQQDLIETVRHRLADRRRAQLVADVLQAQAEIANGTARVATVDEIMREISR